MPERYLGRTLGKYRVTRLLGAGAFAWVYEAVDLDLEIPVALKVLRPEYAGQPAAEARFRREATTAARLRHPNIVFIRDVGEAEGAVFVAMDLLPLSLARRLEVFPRLAEAEVVRFALEVSAALSIAHADGVVHRDIKPDNVMLGGNGEAIVADFGLAGAFAKEGKRDHASDDPGKVMGTPHYFSPEQARGLDLDGRTDLYSLGVMCYRAATGTLPFEGDDWYSVARQHVEETPVPPRMLVPELTEGFEAIVLRLLAKKPEHRFASATQLADALLTLPTAPAAHSLGLTPSSASITQVAFPYLHAAVGKRSWKRSAVLGSIAITLTAVVALFATPLLNELRRGTRTNPEGLLTTPVNFDSTLVPKPDSVPTTNLATIAAPSIAKPQGKPAGSARTPAKTGTVLVSVTANDSAARIFVNGEAKEYGYWEGQLPIGRPVVFIANIENQLKGCRVAKREATRTFTDEKSANVELLVSRCSVLLLSAKNTNNAEYLITSRDSTFEPKNDKYNGSPVPIVLPNGVYRLVMTSDRCSNFKVDSLVVGLDSMTKADTLKKMATMDCPTRTPDRDR